ncbi:MAG: RluA family pseudouridine synthase [Deltaproteobacteria bacterium]|nr:RluA family pseudouridine synthase [Deltaproteobacteria bacterium]
MMNAEDFAPTDDLDLDPIRDDQGRLVFEVPFDSSGMRVDAFVSAKLPALSRARVSALVKSGDILVDDNGSKPAKKLSGGEIVTVDIPPPEPTEFVAQDLSLNILFEDDDFLVIDKAPGMVVHPGAGHRDGTVLNALLFHVPSLADASEARPGIVHRLDKETSGVMVCAKNDLSHRRLSAAFAAREVDKRYRVFTLGSPKEEDFDLVTGHKRDRADRKRFNTRCDPPDENSIKTDNRMAHSTFHMVRKAVGFCELEVVLHTGRTHQIRAHLTDIGCPVVQDELYGGMMDKRGKGFAPSPMKDVARKLKRQALHAEQLSFKHPMTGEPLVFKAPLPDDMRLLQDALRTYVEEAGR